MAANKYFVERSPPYLEHYCIFLRKSIFRNDNRPNLKNIFFGKSYYIKKLTQFSLGWGSTMVWIYRIFNKLDKWRFVLGNFSCGWTEKYDRKRVGSFHYYSMGHHSMTFLVMSHGSLHLHLIFSFMNFGSDFQAEAENLYYLLNPQFWILGKKVLNFVGFFNPNLWSGLPLPIRMNVESVC